VNALLQELAGIPGLREAEPGEFTRRALENGRIDLTEAEGLADLLEAETESQRRAALAVARGGLRHQVETWRHRLVSLSAQAEAAIDYVDDKDETAADAAQLASAVRELEQELRGWLARPRAEKLKDGVRVVLAGPPNAGKSSLLNALVGDERAIVTEIAGTTRDVIEVPASYAGIPFVFVDTAGLRNTDDTVERIGVDRASEQVQAADVLLWLGADQDAPQTQVAVKVHSQADRPERKVAPADRIAVSAVTGLGLDQLRQAIAAMASRQLPSEDQLAINQRQAAAIEEAVESLSAIHENDLVLIAEALRRARAAMDRLTGRAGIEDVLDALFGRFCLGK
jgi:tRNA modification GTPase